MYNTNIFIQFEAFLFTLSALSLDVVLKLERQNTKRILKKKRKIKREESVYLISRFINGIVTKSRNYERRDKHRDQ